MLILLFHSGFCEEHFLLDAGPQRVPLRSPDVPFPTDRARLPAAGQLAASGPALSAGARHRLSAPGRSPLITTSCRRIRSRESPLEIERPHTPAGPPPPVRARQRLWLEGSAARRDRARASAPTSRARAQSRLRLVAWKRRSPGARRWCAYAVEANSSLGIPVRCSRAWDAGFEHRLRASSRARAGRRRAYRQGGVLGHQQGPRDTARRCGRASAASTSNRPELRAGPRRGGGRSSACARRCRCRVNRTSTETHPTSPPASKGQQFGVAFADAPALTAAPPPRLR